MTQQARKTALVISGGGAYAAYGVGVMKALFAGHSPSTDYRPLEPDIIVGTAAGAMNAGILAAHDAQGLTAAVDTLEQIWLSQIAEGTSRCGNGVYRIRGLPVEFFDVNCFRSKPLGLIRDVFDDAFRAAAGTASLAVSPSRLLNPLAEFNLSALIDITPFLESLNRFIPIEGLRNTRQRLRIVAMNLSSGKTRIFDENEIARLGYAPFLASTALPVFFPPYEIEGDLYIDGSTLMNTPLVPTIREAEDLHMIYMDPDVKRIERGRLQSSIDVIDRILVVQFADAINRDINTAREINLGIDVMERAGGDDRLTNEDICAFLKTASRIYSRITEGQPYRKVTIHRYHPREDLGESLGLMNLDINRLRRIIDLGYHDAVAYDPVESGSVLAS
jgi:NTE family protein